MGKGFAPVKAKPAKPLAKSVKLTPISQIQADLSSYFNDIKDPRVKRTKKHLLKDILVIAILAVISGAEGWEDIENYGYAKQQWLEEFLELPHEYRATILFVGFLRGSILQLSKLVLPNG